MNYTNNNSFEIAARKVFSDLYVLKKEDEYKIYNNRTDEKNVISIEIDDKKFISIEIDDKPKPVNLLDLNTDI